VRVDSPGVDPGGRQRGGLGAAPGFPWGLLRAQRPPWTVHCTARRPARAADWQSAIRQAGSLRYGTAGWLPPMTAGWAVPPAAEKRPQAAALHTLPHIAGARPIAKRMECAGWPALWRVWW